MVDIYIGPENTHWVLHEKLLCARSKHFRQLFSTKHKTGSHRGSKTLHLPEEEESSFGLLVGWLYSGRVPAPSEEGELSDLLELYLVGEKWEMPRLAHAVLDTVRTFYRRTDSFPCLRRVQYVYANTDADHSALRRLMVGSVARMLVLGEAVPAHWERALRKNGPMAFDIIRAVQTWRLEPESIPDARREEEDQMPEVLNGDKVEEMQEGASEGELERSELDAAAAAPRDVERLGINGYLGSID